MGTTTGIYAGRAGAFTDIRASRRLPEAGFYFETAGRKRPTRLRTSRSANDAQRRRNAGRHGSSGPRTTRPHASVDLVVLVVFGHCGNRIEDLRRQVERDRNRTAASTELQRLQHTL